MASWRGFVILSLCGSACMMAGLGAVLVLFFIAWDDDLTVEFVAILASILSCAVCLLRVLPPLLIEFFVRQVHLQEMTIRTNHMIVLDNNSNLMQIPDQSGEKTCCIICMNNINAFEQARIVIGCGHIFHRACFESWWLHKPIRSGFQCPQCSPKHWNFFQ
mmetsp:Transcript_96411/g.241714  ORF Transcript_96411/g.241714 Transcript_96411/m.241714 type:complete len:161 (+) Transcript_96411:69-551(+)